MRKKKRTRKMVTAAAISLSMVAGLLSPGMYAKAEELPSSLDLRDRGVVTSVKNQDPFGSCWAFGGSAASEISILTQMGLTNDKYIEKYGRTLNLSEKHLNWWTYHAVPKNDPEDASQAGEGTYIFKENPKDKVKRNAAYNVGGLPLYVTSIYSSGSGPLLELGRDRYHGYKGKNNKKISWAEDADWTLKDSSRDYLSFVLKDGNMLPVPAIYSDEATEDGFLNYAGYNEEGTLAIKRELNKGHGVALVYEADASRPQELESGVVASDYVSENWAQYKDENIMPNHMVCAIGYDDNYPVENFNSDHRPPAPGAFLIKNSWGTATAKETSHNYREGYGIVDDQGRSTGYFWLSYYDQSICMAESFTFEKALNDDDEVIVGQYDLLQGGVEDALDLSGRKKTQMANVFVAPKKMKLTALGADTFAENTKVRFDVYRVSEGTTNPTRGKKVLSKTVTVPYAGYHRVKVGGSHIFQKGEYYSVVVTETVKTAKGAVYIANASYGYDKILSKLSGAAYYSKAVVNKGESFYGVMEKGKMQWEDWSDCIKESEKADPTGLAEHLEIDNFGIKAFSEPVK